MMNIFDAIRQQPALEKAWSDYCKDENDEKFDAELERWGLVRDEDGDIHDAP